MHQGRLRVGRVALNHVMGVQVLPLVPNHPIWPNGKAAVRKTATIGFDSRGRVHLLE
jgi:hypothetical protein